MQQRGELIPFHSGDGRAAVHIPEGKECPSTSVGEKGKFLSLILVLRGVREALSASWCPSGINLFYWIISTHGGEK